MVKSMCELVLAIIAIVVGLWQLVQANWGGVSSWVLLVIGIVLLFHSFMCKRCFAMSDMPKRGRRR